MPDLLFLCLTVVFFALCWALAMLCERLGSFAQSENQGNRAIT